MDAILNRYIADAKSGFRGSGRLENREIHNRFAVTAFDINDLTPLR
jgi:hypothetical protein